jgi:hypothetical protein
MTTLAIVVHTTDNGGQLLVLAAYILGMLMGAGSILAGLWFHR